LTVGILDVDKRIISSRFGQLIASTLSRPQKVASHATNLRRFIKNVIDAIRNEPNIFRFFAGLLLIALTKFLIFKTIYLL
jgi:hypothetical protein